LRSHNGVYGREAIFNLWREPSDTISPTLPKASALSQLRRLIFQSGAAPDDPVSIAFRSEAYAFKHMTEADNFSWPTIKSAIVRYLDAQLKAGLQNPNIHRR